MAEPLTHLKRKAAPSVREASQPAALQPAQPLAVQRRALRQHGFRPAALQRQVVAPVLQAATLHRQETERVASQQASLQRQASTLATVVAPEALQGALQRQQEQLAPVVAPLRPASPGDWVTVMRAQAQSLEAWQANGRRLDARQVASYTALQRQVAGQLVQGYRSDHSATRAATIAGQVLALQRHPLSASVAQAVMGMVPSGERPLVQRAVDEALQRQATQQAQDAQAMELHALQRQLADLESEAAQPVFRRIQARRGAGSALPEAVQRHLEQGLNHDLSRVRVHTDADADALAKGVNATAFTTGNDIFFRAGRFAPNTRSGLELLAHEVIHTVQQAQGRVGPGVDPDAGLEAEAQTIGARLGARLSRTVPKGNGKPGTALRRTPLSGPFAVQRKAAAGAPTSAWRQNGKLRGQPPVRDEANPPNPNVVEDEQKYRVLLAGARQLLVGQRQRAASMLKADKSGVRDYRFWFARVYSHVTENEILFAEQGTYDYPSYVMQCVLYFDKLYADNLMAIKAKVEPHWKASFDTAQRMQDANKFTQLPNSVFSLVSAMLAHIRFDLPRAEAWVTQSYQKAYGAKPADFRADFFRMGGVFDNASRSMFQDMKKLLPDSISGAAWSIDKMSQWNWTSGAMRHLLGADMSAERLQTWRRMEAMVAQGKVPANPYTLQGGRLTGNTTAKTLGSSTAPLGQIRPATLRPSMEGIDARWSNRIGQGLKGMVGSQLDTTEGEVAAWQRTFNTPATAQKVPVYERARILLTLIKNPAMRIEPLLVMGVIPVDSPKDDALIVSILKASLVQGDLPLLVNMVDAQTLLSTIEVTDHRRAAEQIFVSSGYYRTLGSMNATNQIVKWFEAGDDPLNIRSAQRIYQSLPSSIRPEVSRMLKARHIPDRVYQ